MYKGLTGGIGSHAQPNLLSVCSPNCARCPRRFAQRVGAGDLAKFDGVAIENWGFAIILLDLAENFVRFRWRLGETALKMELVRIGGLVLLGAVAVQSPAVAQDVAPTTDVRHIDVSLSVRETYDTNVARTDKATAQLRGLRTVDELTSPSISVDALQPVGGQALFLTGLVAYDSYVRNSQLDRENINLTTGLNAKLGACRSTLSGSYRRAQSDLAQLSLANSSVVQNVEQTTLGDVNFTCGRNLGLTSSFDLTASNSENSANVYQQLNNNGLNATFSVGYRRASLGTLSVYGQYGRTEFPQRQVPIKISGSPPAYNIQFATDSFNQGAAGLRYERNAGSRITVTARLAYSTLTPGVNVVQAPGTPPLTGGRGFEGVSYGGDITYRPTPRLQAEVKFDRDIKPSNQVDASYFLDQHYVLAADYALGTRIKVRVGVDDEDSNYRGGLIHKGFDLTQSTIVGGFASVDVAVLRKIHVVLDVRTEKRTADIHAYDYESTRVGLALTARF